MRTEPGTGEGAQEGDGYRPEGPPASTTNRAGVAMHSNGMFGDGAIVFGGLVNWARGDEPPPAGYERLTNPYYSVSLDGTGIVHFGEFPGTEVFWRTSQVDGRSSLAAAFIHFGKSPRAMARGDRLVLGTRDTPHAETMPAFGSLLLDSEGCIWVEDVYIPGDTLRTWTVFGPEGVPLTRLSLSTRNRVLDVGEDYVLAVFEDDLGVEFVRSYPLNRGK